MVDDCPTFSSCSAPICPAWRESMREGVWTADMPICRRRWPGGAPRWVRLQREIVRRRLAGGPWNVAELALARIVRGHVVIDSRRVRPESLAAVLRWLESLEPRPTPERARKAYDRARAAALEAAGSCP